MSTLQSAPLELDEQRWRAWVDKGRAREQVRAKRRQKIFGVLLAIALAAIAAVLLFGRSSG